MKIIVVKWSDGDYGDHAFPMEVPKDESEKEIEKIVKEKVWDQAVTECSWREKGKEDEINEVY